MLLYSIDINGVNFQMNSKLHNLTKKQENVTNKVHRHITVLVFLNAYNILKTKIKFQNVGTNGPKIEIIFELLIFVIFSP